MTKPTSKGDVGYGRPPAETQFKPGNSFGKRKRKRKVKPLDAYNDIEAVLNHRVPITIAGEVYKVPIYEALLLRLREVASTGNARALKMIEKIRQGMPVIDDYQAQLDDWNRISFQTRLKLDRLVARAKSVREEESDGT